jgi:hypothetical protein
LTDLIAKTTQESFGSETEGSNGKVKPDVSLAAA